MQTHIKDFKPSNVQDSDKELPGLFGVQHLINAKDHPQKHLLIDWFGQSTNWIVDLYMTRTSEIQNAIVKTWSWIIHQGSNVQFFCHTTCNFCGWNGGRAIYQQDEITPITHYWKDFLLEEVYKSSRRAEMLAFFWSCVSVQLMSANPIFTILLAPFWSTPQRAVWLAKLAAQLSAVTRCCLCSGCIGAILQKILSIRLKFTVQ